MTIRLSRIFSFNLAHSNKEVFVTLWCTAFQGVFKAPETRSPAVARLADCTRCQLPSKSSKVDDFHFS